MLTNVADLSHSLYPFDSEPVITLAAVAVCTQENSPAASDVVEQGSHGLSCALETSYTSQYTAAHI